MIKENKEELDERNEAEKKKKDNKKKNLKTRSDRQIFEQKSFSTNNRIHVIF